MLLQAMVPRKPTAIKPLRSPEENSAAQGSTCRGSHNEISGTYVTSINTRNITV
jgi:hypothetical protein